MIELEGKYTSATIFASQIGEGVKKQTLDICNHPIFEGCPVKTMPDLPNITSTVQNIK